MSKDLSKGLQDLSLKKLGPKKASRGGSDGGKKIGKQRRGSLVPTKEVTRTRRRLSVVAGSQDTKQYKLDGIKGDKTTEEHENTAKTFQKYAYVSKVGYVPFNPNKVNQDRPAFIPKFDGDDNKSFWGVFDGHGSLGHEVSEWVRTKLPQRVAAAGSKLKDDPIASITSAFVATNSALSKSKIDCTFSGTTAIVCYIDGTKLYTFNAGDSRACLATDENGELKAVELSIDQKPEREDEAKRIIDNKGRVDACKGLKGEDIGPARVWLQHQDVPGLAMTRSFGDLIAASVGVIATPECIVRDLSPKDKFIILGSDGIWEFIENQEAIDIVKNCKSPEEACKVLTDEATRRWQAEEEVIDDITCVIVWF